MTIEIAGKAASQEMAVAATEGLAASNAIDQLQKNEKIERAYDKRVDSQELLSRLVDADHKGKAAETLTLLKNFLVKAATQGIALPSDVNAKKNLNSAKNDFPELFEPAEALEDQV